MQLTRNVLLEKSSSLMLWKINSVDEIQTYLWKLIIQNAPESKHNNGTLSLYYIVEDILCPLLNSKEYTIEQDLSNGYTYITIFSKNEQNKTYKIAIYNPLFIKENLKEKISDIFQEFFNYIRY